MSVSIPNASVLDRLVLVGLDVNIWSARKKLHREELDVNVKLPPAEMFSLGSKNVIDLSHLSVFESLKRRAMRAIDGPGVRLMGAVGVPDSVHLDVVKELQGIQAEFNLAKADFLNNLDRYHEEWIEKSKADPEWQAVLRSSATPKAYVERALNFSFSMCRLIPDQSSAATSEGLVRQINGLAGQLYAEVADEACKIIEFLRNRESVSQKTVNRLKGVHGKLCSMAFVDRDVQELADYLGDRLNALPQTGKLEGSEYRELISLVNSLCHEDRIVALVKALASNLPLQEVNEFAGLDDVEHVVESFDQTLLEGAISTEAVVEAEVQAAQEVLVDDAEQFMEIEAETAEVSASFIAPQETQQDPADTQATVHSQMPEIDSQPEEAFVDFCM